MKPTFAISRLLCIATSSLLAISYAHAASTTWNVDLAGDWATDANWLSGTAPGATIGTTSADVATFGSIITAARIVTVDADRNISGINFNANSFAYTLSGGNILLSNGGTVQTSSAGTGHTDTISSAIAIQGDAGAAAFTSGSGTAARLLVISGGVTGVSTGSNVTMLTLNGANTGNNIASGVIGNGSGSGTLAVTKSGAGSWTLSNASNTYSGGTFINAGTLTANSNGNLGASAGGITFTGNSTLAMTGTITHARQITLNSGVTGTILSGAGITYTNSGKVTGAGNLTFTQTGNGVRNLTFSNLNNDFTGAVRVENTSGQQLAVTFNSLADAVGAGNVIMTMSGANGPNTLSYGSGATSPLTLNNRRFELTGSVNVVNAIFSNQNAARAITINTDLLISSTGNKALSLDAVAGPTNVFAGKLANGSFSAATQVFSVNKTGAGTWSFTHTANSYTGNTTISAGLLNVTKLANGGSNSSIGASGAGAANLVFNSGTTLRYLGSGDSTDRQFTYSSTADNTGFNINSSGSGALSFTNTGTITYTGTANQIRFITLTGTNTGDNTFAGTIGNNGTAAVNLTKGGSSKWVLTNANSYTGGTFVQSGTLELKSDAANLTQSIGSLTTNVSEATLISNKSGAGTLSTTFANRGRNAGGSVNIVSQGGINGTDNTINVTGGALGFIDKGTFFNGADFAAQSAISGFVRALDYGTDPSAAAVDTITASNHTKITSSFSGAGVTLLSLNLAGSGVGWENTSGNLTVPGILKSGGGSVAAILGGAINPTNTELVVRTDTTSDSLSISSNLTQGTGALTKSGAGILTLSGTNTYTGASHINAGTLSIGANVHLGAPATGATLNLKGGTLQATGTFGLHNGSPGTNNRAVVLLNQSGIDVTSSNTLTIAGVISNSGSAGTVAPGFNKTGTGTLELRGANTYTGSTVVDAGTLALGANNVLPNTSPISIGNATLNADTFTDTAGTLDPTSTATVNLGAGATLAFADSSTIDWTGGTLAITGTFVSGSSLRFGTTSGGLTPTQLGLITGAGPVTLDASGFLVSAGGGNTYADWLTANSPATGFVTDSDNDGISNGVENVLGSNPNAYNAGLTQISATPTTATYQHTLNPTLASDVTYGYEWSTDLVEWKTTGQTNTGLTTATISPSAPVLGVVTVTVSITSGPSAKLFSRLSAVK